MNIVLFGAPGAGKGTQSELLVKKQNMLHISTGDLLRDSIKKKTPMGLEAKKFMDAGQLVPDGVMIGIIEGLASDLKKKPFILDGFPRTIPQATVLGQVLSKHGLKIDKAIFVEVPFDILLKRLSGRRVCEKCGAVFHVQSKPMAPDGTCTQCGGKVYQRSDDKEDVISNRLEAYNKNTSPLKDYYREIGLYSEVNGLGSADDVYVRITKLLN